MPAALTSARVYFHTLGCPKNEADSRALMRRLDRAGVTLADDPASATHIVINTCGFIQDAKEESIDAILSVCRGFPGARVLVMGCLVDRYREDLSKGIPEVSEWLGVAGAGASEELVRAITGLGATASGVPPRSSLEGKSYAYLKISDGCDEGCTFCAIPGFKGPYRSVPADEILQEADACLSEGARELVLVGQETTRWSSDGLDLSGLIDALAADDRVRWIRVMYMQPSLLDDQLLEFMAGHDKLCRYLDIPFQHSHGDVLKRMGRRGEGAAYLRLIERAREMMPGVAVRSTFIVGFPGETEMHFGHLMAFVRGAQFEYGGAFVYSPEEGTSAARLRPVVSRRVAQRRLNLLNEALLETGEEVRERLVGTEVEVLIDSVDETELMEGCIAVARTQGQAPEIDGVTYIRASNDAPPVVGATAKVRVGEVLGCDLVGDICAT